MTHLHWVTRQNELEIPNDKDEVRGQDDRIPANEEKNKFSRVKKHGAGDCCDAAQTDKVSDRDCGRGYSRQKGQDDPACGWAICE